MSLFKPVKPKVNFWVESLIALMAGLGLGAATFFVSPLILLGGLIAIPIGLYLLKNPVPILLAMIIGYSTIINIDLIPLLPIGIGSLNLLDVALLAFLGLIVLRRIFEDGFQVYLALPELTLIGFILVLGFSTLFGLDGGSTTLGEATTEIRYYFYYAVYFVVIALITDKRQLNQLVIGLLSLAALSAAAVVAQYIIGDSFQLVYGRVETFAQDGAEVAGVTRVIPSGRYLIWVGFIIFTTLISSSEKVNWPYALGWGLTGLAVLISFNRNLWVSAVIVIGIIFLIQRPLERARFIRFFSTIFVAGMLILGLLVSMPNSTAGDLTLSILTRFGSIFDIGTYLNDFQADNVGVSSLEFRRIENEYAFPLLAEGSLIGLGPGSFYREFDPRLDFVDFDGRGYIHNAHLWILLKLGYFGYVTLIITYLTIIGRGLLSRDLIFNPIDRAIFIGVSLSQIGILISANVDPIFSDIAWTPLCGILFGIHTVYLRENGYYKRMPSAGPDTTTDNIQNKGISHDYNRIGFNRHANL